MKSISIILLLALTGGCASMVLPIHQLSDEQIRKQNTARLCMVYRELKNMPESSMTRTTLEREHPDWFDRVKTNIVRRTGQTGDQFEIMMDKQIRIGMTTQAVLCAWGNPTRINNTTSQFGRSQQLVYGSYGRAYVYTDNGVVTTIQN